MNRFDCFYLGVILGLLLMCMAIKMADWYKSSTTGGVCSSNQITTSNYIGVPGCRK